MTVGELQATPAIAHPGESLRSSAVVAAILASFVGVLAFAPNLANSARAAWLGHRILATHAVDLRLGAETFTAPGAHTYEGWLGAVIVALAGAFTGGVAVVGVAAFFGALAVALVRTRERGGGAIACIAVAALSTVAALGTVTSPTATLDWLLLSATLLLVERGGARGAYVCVALAIVWCNVSAQGLLVPGILLAAAGAARACAGADSPRVRTLIRAGALAVVAMALTPAFLGLPLRGATYLRIDPTFSGLHAWQPALMPAHAYTLGVVGLVAIAALFGVWRRDRALDAVLVVGGALFAFLNAQFVPEFVLVASPIIVTIALAALRFDGRAFHRSATALGFCTAGAVALVAAAFAPASSEAGGATHLPLGLVAPLAADGRAHRIYCASIDACDAFVASGDPNLRVFMDGRDAAYPHSVIEDQTTIAKVRPGWRARLEVWKVDAIVVRSSQQLAEVVALLPRIWHLRSRDGTALLFVRTVPPR